jgi:ankyrin repeat protein
MNQDAPAHARFHETFHEVLRTMPLSLSISGMAPHASVEMGEAGTGGPLTQDEDSVVSHRASDEFDDDEFGDEGIRALALAVQLASDRAAGLGDVRLLLQRGVAADTLMSNGQTVLMKAAHSGHLKLCQLLIDANASPAAVDWEGFSPLHTACLGQQLEPPPRPTPRGTPDESRDDESRDDGSRDDGAPAPLLCDCAASHASGVRPALS